MLVPELVPRGIVTCMVRRPLLGDCTREARYGGSTISAGLCNLGAVRTESGALVDFLAGCEPQKKDNDERCVCKKGEKETEAVFVFGDQRPGHHIRLLPIQVD